MKNITIVISVLFFISCAHYFNNDVYEIAITAKIDKSIPAPYSTEIRALPLKADFILPPFYDFGTMVEDRLILGSINEEVVDIFDNLSGDLIRRLKADCKDDPFNFSRPKQIYVRSDEKGEDIIHVLDGWANRVFKYNLEGDYLGFFDSYIFYEDFSALNDSIDILSTHGVNNAHVKFDNLFLGGADFIITKNGSDYKTLGKNHLGFDFISSFYQQRHFFNWGRHIGYYNSFLDSIFVIDEKINKNVIALNFNDVGDFANLYNDIKVESKVTYAYENDLIYIHDVSYNDDLLTIRFFKRGVMHYYVHDTEHSDVAFHIDRFFTDGYPDLTLNQNLVLGKNQFGGMLHYYDFLNLLNSTKSDSRFYAQAERFVRESGVEDIKSQVLEAGKSLYLHNPIFYISTIKKNNSKERINVL